MEGSRTTNANKKWVRLWTACRRREHAVARPRGPLREIWCWCTQGDYSPDIRSQPIFENHAMRSSTLRKRYRSVFPALVAARCLLKEANDILPE